MDPQQPLAPSSPDPSLAVNPLDLVGHQQTQTPGEAQTTEVSAFEQALRTGFAGAHEGIEVDTNHAVDLADVRYFSSLLKKLVSFIAHGEKESVSRVVSTIRSGASYDEIIEAIDHESENNIRSVEKEEVVSFGAQ